MTKPAEEAITSTILLSIAIAAMFVTSPNGGDFWWSDSPRHALNGVFVWDLLTNLPIADVREYAINYYLQYPALTILLYPPLFYVISAPFFGIFGVSHTVALLPVMLMYLLLASGCFFLARRWFGFWVALAAAIAFVGAPEIARWGRQVMLEIPCAAFLVWSLYFLFRNIDTHRSTPLYLSFFFFICAIYIKLSAVFMGPVLICALLLYRGWPVLKDRPLWITAAFVALALIPLAVLTVKFGQANVQSVAGIEDANVARGSLEGWLWYLRQLPSQLGWVTVALAGAGIVGSLLRPGWGIPWRDAAVLAGWFGIGYLFFSAIALKEARHTTLILFPVIVAAVLLIDRTLNAWKAPAAMLFGLAVLVATLLWYPVPAVAGYRHAADYVASHAPHDSRVLFSGYRDGSFVFNMRQHEERRDLTVLRADKMLLRIAVRRELGVVEQDLTEGQIADRINQAGVHYVVAQTDFWTDLTAMARLQAVLRSPQFEVVNHIRIEANVPTQDRELVIYRNLGPVAAGNSRIHIDLPIIDRNIEGIGVRTAP